MADRKISDLTALTTPATGDLIPIVDISEAAAADKNKSITVGELLRGAPDGTAAAPGFAFESDGGNGMFLGGTDILAFSTGGNQAVTIDASQRLGLGTSSPGTNLDIVVDSGTATQKLGSSSVAGGSYLNLHGASASKTWFIGANYNFAGVLEFTQSTANGGTTPSSTPAMVLSAAGNVGIGTTSPGQALHVIGKGRFQESASSGAIAYIGANATEAYIDTGTYGTNQPFAFKIEGSEAARIDDSKRLLVGTSSSRTGYKFETEGTASNNGWASFNHNSNDGVGAILKLLKSRGTAVGSNTIVQSGDIVGRIDFDGTDGSVNQTAAQIYAAIDGTPGAADMPGRLVFSTTADGASSPTERMRINSNGFAKFTTTGSYVQGGEYSYYEFLHNDNNLGLVLTCTNASYASDALFVQVSRAASSSYDLATFWSDLGNDREFALRGDGNGYCDGSWNGGGADYAEYFEWSDGNTTTEDRRGISVVLDGDKIREAVAGEEPIGVISGNPSVVGDAAWNKWSGKYLRDDFGTYIQENYEVEDEDGNTVTQQRRKLNPDYDPDVEYINREDRPEWDCVGLMGKLRIRKGQVTGARWIKMRDISDSVEEWLVR